MFFFKGCNLQSLGIHDLDESFQSGNIIEFKTGENMAERGGFEPPEQKKLFNRFRVCRLRPLSHLSLQNYSIM